MKKTISAMTLAATLMFGSTFTFAEGIIVGDRNEGIIVGDSATKQCQETSKEGIIVGDFFDWIEGIIVGDRSDATGCDDKEGIIVGDRTEGIIVGD